MFCLHRKSARFNTESFYVVYTSRWRSDYAQGDFSSVASYTTYDEQIQ